MVYNVFVTQTFQKQVKHLLKKYASLKQDLLQLEHSLKTNPIQGVHLGNSLRKVRLAVKSKGKGKSGGLRVITFIINNTGDIFLLYIYDKSEVESVGNETLRSIVRGLKIDQPI